MPTSTLVLGIALLAIIGSLSVIAFVRRRSYRSAWYPTVRFHYETFSKRISYRIEHHGALHYSRKFLVKAMQDNLDGYTDRFVWTGGESDARSQAPVRQTLKRGWSLVFGRSFMLTSTGRYAKEKSTSSKLSGQVFITGKNRARSFRLQQKSQLVHCRLTC